MTPIIQATNIRKTYGETIAVHDVNFSVSSGECFGLLGPNGAGKSTTINLLACQFPLTDGQLTINGMAVDQESRKIRAQLGVVSQSDNLDDALTVLQNLLVHGRYYNLAKHAINERAKELLNLFDLSHVSQDPIDTLSGGMKRRLVIARALIHQPTVLILDEPTTGLDPQVRQLVWQRIRLLRERGVTVVLSTHYMDEAFQLCDRVAIMDLGRIVAVGTPSTLISEYAGNQIIDLNQSDNGPSLTELVTRLQQEQIPYFARSSESISVTYTGAKMDWLLELATSPLRPATLEDVFLRVTGREFMDYEQQQ